MARNKELVKGTDGGPVGILPNIAIRKVIGKRMALLEQEASRIIADVVATDRSLQLVSTEGNFSALIKQGGVTIEIENGDFAISTRT